MKSHREVSGSIKWPWNLMVALANLYKFSLHSIGCSLILLVQGIGIYLCLYSAKCSLSDINFALDLKACGPNMKKEINRAHCMLPALPLFFLVIIHLHFGCIYTLDIYLFTFKMHMLLTLLCEKPQLALLASFLLLDDFNFNAISREFSHYYFWG